MSEGADAITRAFAVGDIAGSCALWNRHTELMNQALAAHDRLAAAIVASAGGHIVKNTGDGFLAEFATADAAVGAMVEYQRRLAETDWPGEIELRSRVAVHVGEAIRRDGDRFGPTINTLMRVAELVEPTHVVLTDATAEALDRRSADALSLGRRRVRDVEQPVELYAVSHGRTIGPAIVGAAGRGLPRFDTPFVGRGTDAARLRQLLEVHRLVSIVGFGGVGKTRLAVDVATQWSSLHGDDTHFADLLSDPVAVSAIAAAVGAPLDEPATTEELIVETIGDRRVLVVVDNCEHVIDDVAEVIDRLSRRCPGLVVLATTREPLELPGEVQHRLAGLDSDAGAMLLERRLAAHAVPVPDVELCRRIVEAVDGLPLGIELAAARLRTADAEELLRQLARSSSAVDTRPQRGTGAQHHSLSEMIASSLDLLDRNELTALWLMAHFPAAIPPGAATIVLDPIPLSVLDELIAKSLVHLEDREVRMLGVVRQHVLERGPLGDSEADADAGLGGLIRWARHFAPCVDDDLRLRYDPQAARAFAAQAANLDAALDAAVQLGRLDDEAAILTGLWPLVTQAAGRTWFDGRVAAALDRCMGTSHEQTVMRLALTAGENQHVDDGMRMRVVARLSEIDPQRTWPIWRTIAFGEQLQAILTVPVIGGDPEVPRAVLHELHAQAVADANPVDQVTAQLFLAFSHLLGAQPADARPFAEQAGAVARRLGIAPMVGLTDATAALAWSAAGEHEIACHVAESALPLARGARWESVVRSAVTLTRLAASGPSSARAGLVELIDFALDDDVPFVIFDAVAVLAAWCVADDDPARARQVLEHASIARSPATCAVIWHTANAVEFDLGLDRFTDAFEPSAFRRRADAAASMLRVERARLVAEREAPIESN